MADHITITLPDDSTRELPTGATAADLAAAIGKRLAADALVAEVDGSLVDLSTPLEDGARVAIVTPTTDDGREVLRHSTSHVLAQAVLALFGNFAIVGPMTLAVILANIIAFVLMRIVGKNLDA